MADPLTAPFAELCTALRGLQEQVEQLAHVHEAMDDFNAAFGAFQGAMALHASCLDFPRPPSPPVVRAAHKSSSLPKDPPASTGIPLPSSTHVSPAASANKREGSKNSAGSRGGASADRGKNPRKSVAAGMKRSGKADPNGPRNTRPKKRRKPATPKKAAPAWTWERHIREKIPRKYQPPAELKKLENILLYLKNRHSAISIADLVKHSGLPVIRCKEILQTLMKLELIERKREQSGFLYVFGCSN